MGHVWRITCHLSHVIKANSHMHNPAADNSPNIHSICNQPKTHNKSKLPKKFRPSWGKKVLKFWNISHTLFDQNPSGQRDPEFPVEERHTIHGHCNF